MKGIVLPEDSDSSFYPLLYPITRDSSKQFLHICGKAIVYEPISSADVGKNQLIKINVRLQ